MKEIAIKSFKIKTLLDHVEAHRFAVPEIQREFVWDATRACKLLDSIYKCLPIGTMMLWETNTKHRDLLRHSLNILPPFDNNNKMIWFLIDGQQRLSVLHQVHKGSKIINASGKEINFNNIYFDLTGEYDLSFTYRKRHSDSNSLARVSDLLSSRWRSKFRNWPQSQKRKVEECRNRLFEYSVPVVFLQTSDLDEVRESFLRINSQGMKITSADRAFARATKLNLRHLIREAKVNWQAKGYDQVPNQIILSALALLEGQNDVGDRAIDAFVKKLDKKIINNDHRKKFSKEWVKIRECFGKAIDYLSSNFGVINHAFLPSDNIVMLLALFFYYNNKAQPNASQKQELRKWFWATATGQRYSGRGHRKNIIKDAEFFRQLGARGRKKFKLETRLPVSNIKNCDYSRRSALNSAFSCLLALHHPRYLESGDAIPLANYAAASNKENKHHIFPKAPLTRRGFSLNQRNSICNICFVVAQENQSVNDTAPRVYLKEYKQQNSRVFSRVMKSHLIPCRPDSGLWETDMKKGYKLFIKKRMQMICSAFEKEAGIKLFQKD